MELPAYVGAGAVFASPADPALVAWARKVRGPKQPIRP